MIRSAKLILVFCIFLFSGSLLRAVISSSDLDMDYAQHMPLATRSILLDITRVGDTLVAVGERGIIVTSTDGLNWVQADVVPTRSTLTTVFSDGHRLWAGGHDTVILTSGDKGKNWTRQNFDPVGQQAVMDILFTDGNNGVAIGSYGLYLRTSDGGHSWQEARVDEEVEYHLNSLLVFEDQKWLIAGEAGYSYRSYDGGETWEALDLPYQGSMWGSLKTDDGCVLFFGLRGHVIKSCDFGTSWIELETGSTASISAAAEHEGLVLFAANSGTVLVMDENNHFDVHHHSDGVDFAGVMSLGDGNYLLVGEEGVHRYPETGDGMNGDD